MTAALPERREVEARARASLGASAASIHSMVARALAARTAGGVLLDVGCGTGDLWRVLRDRFDRYVGVDVLRYEGFPEDGTFAGADLDSELLPCADGEADVVVAVETIEHLENPRAFMRDLVRAARPGGWVAVTTPNQLSALSVATLVFKRRFVAFQSGDYPAHRTALLEIDLRRIAAECGLRDVAIGFSGRGRIALTPWHYPALLSRAFPRACSDNVLMVGRKPVEARP